MRITAIHPREFSGSEVGAWSAILAPAPELAGPYYRPEFTCAVGQVRQDVRVAILEDGGRVVGFFPHQRGRLGLGRPVGGALSDHQALIIGPGVEPDPMRLLEGCRLRAWSFDHLLASQACLRAYHTATAPSPIIDLSEGFSAYEAGRRAAGSRQLSKLDNLRRRIEREHAPLRFVLRDPDPRTLSTIFAWKSRQYVESRSPDAFAPKWTRALVERLVASDTPCFAGMVSALYCGDRLIAAHMGMRSATVWHYWFPVYDREYELYSPGLLLLTDMCRAAEGLGLRSIDLGKGDALYKQRLANSGIEIAEGCVQRPGPLAAWRRWRTRAEAWSERSRLRAIARVPWQALRRLEHLTRFR